MPKRPDNQKWRYLRTVAGVAARSGRDEFYGLAGGTEMRTHHRGVALETAAGENDGVGIESSGAAGLDFEAANATLDKA